MSQSPVESAAEPASEPTPETATPPDRPPSFVKLAMRNMVRKGGKSLYHFGLTTLGLFALLIGLAYLTR
jgi:hypothetical protein